jgi:hypothetical protein
MKIARNEEGFKDDLIILLRATSRENYPFLLFSDVKSEGETTIARCALFLRTYWRTNDVFLKPIYLQLA